MSPKLRHTVVFDVLGTLFHLTPIEEQVGGKAQVDAWFQRLLHTATALTLAGEFRPFPELAESTLRTTLARTEIDADADELLPLLEKLPPYPDAGGAFALLEEAGATLAVLTNGAERSTRGLLAAAGLEDRVVEIVAAEEVELYKPHPAVYRHALERIGADAKSTTLVSAHAWDVAGAKAAGWEAIWVSRAEKEWPLPKGKPRRPASDLEEAARFILEKHGR